MKWLRNMESIRDEQNVAFLGHLGAFPGLEGHYDEKPDLAAFKEVGGY